MSLLQYKHKSGFRTFWFEIMASTVCRRQICSWNAHLSNIMSTFFMYFMNHSCIPACYHSGGGNSCCNTLKIHVLLSSVVCPGGYGMQATRNGWTAHWSAYQRNWVQSAWTPRVCEGSLKPALARARRQEGHSTF